MIFQWWFDDDDGDSDDDDDDDDNDDDSGFGLAVLRTSAVHPVRETRNLIEQTGGCDGCLDL